MNRRILDQQRQGQRGQHPIPIRGRGIRIQLENLNLALGPVDLPLDRPIQAPQAHQALQAQPQPAPQAYFDLDFVADNRGMAYNGYVHSRACRVHSAEWYDVEQLGTVMRAMKKMNFSIVEQRQQAMASLNDLQDAAPYSRLERFPADRIYICVSTGDWIRKFQQIRTSLSYRSHEVRQAQQPNGAVREVHPMTTAESDSLLAFHNAISSIMSQISQGEYIYTRETFEHTMGVEWAPAAQ